MRLRRGEEPGPGVLLATPTGWIADGTRSPTGRAEVLRFAAADAERRAAPWSDAGELVVLIEDGDRDALLLSTSGARRVPHGHEADALACAAARARQDRLRLLKRQRLPDQLIAYFEELNAAEAEDDVFHALAAHALAIVGAHTALALVRDRARGMLRAPARRGADAAEFRACILWDDRLDTPGLVLAVDARCGGRFPFIGPLFGDPQTAQAAYVPIGQEGVLVLTERREERIFEPEDWDVLRALAIQAEMALKRIRLIASVRELSLTDSLTGLANRRHMEVVLAHAWAASRRGEPLAVMVLDLDDFKEVNDREGHLAGDGLLRTVAAALRAEARGADVVVRYGGDEFMVILPGGDAAAARSLAGRVRKRLDGRVELSVGVAEYHAACPSAEELIREADRALYDAKRARAAEAAAGEVPAAAL